jgi:hypothetical protein
MATWIKCTNTKKMTVYVNLDNAVTVMRDDTGQRINERGTVIELMGGEQVYIVVTEQPEEIINRSPTLRVRGRFWDCAKDGAMGVTCSTTDVVADRAGPSVRRPGTSIVSRAPRWFGDRICLIGVLWLNCREPPPGGMHQ